MAKITFALEDGQEVVVPLTDRLSIGRADDNDVVVNDDRLSDQHAEIVLAAEGGYDVRDLGSQNGTFINDQRVKTRRLSQGDRLAFGPLTGVLDLEEPSATPPSASQIEAAEKRLATVEAAASEAESAHAQWLTAIHELAQQHASKSAALEKLNLATSTAEQSLTTLTEQEKQQTSRLDQLRREIVEAETRLTESEQKHQQNTSQSTVLQDQIKTAEQTLHQTRSQLEARLQELASSEEKLAQVLTRTQEAEDRHACLTSTLAALSQDQKRREESLRHLQASLNSCEIMITTRRAELAAETQRLEDARKNRADLEAQPSSKSAVASAASLPQNAPPPAQKTPTIPTPSPSLRVNRIVAIEPTRTSIIPMKSERIIKKSADTSPE